MRYSEKRSIPETLQWLQEQGLPTPRDTFQKFVRRVLNLLTDELASSSRINLEFLRAIRRRLKLPLVPSKATARRVKAVARFASRSRQRRIPVEKKVKHPAVQLAQPPRRERVELDQAIYAATARLPAAPKPADTPQMRGTPEQPVGIYDWHILNGVARKKIFARDRKMYTNDHGRVYHTYSGREYNAEDLVAEFGLTPNEARSCYMSFEGIEDLERRRAA